MIAGVDERRRLADARRRGERGDHDREARAAAGDLGHLAARQSAAEERVERRDGRREDFVAALAGDGADQLRAAGEFRRDRGFERRPQVAKSASDSTICGVMAGLRIGGASRSWNCVSRRRASTAMGKSQGQLRR